MNALKNSEISTASLAELIASATASQIERAEEAATAAMARVRNPFCGAREVELSRLLRKELRGERAELKKTFAAIGVDFSC